MQAVVAWTYRDGDGDADEVDDQDDHDLYDD